MIEGRARCAALHAWALFIAERRPSPVGHPRACTAVCSVGACCHDAASAGGDKRGARARPILQPPALVVACEARAS
jgi:hypothetical protein